MREQSEVHTPVSPVRVMTVAAVSAPAQISLAIILSRMSCSEQEILVLQVGTRPVRLSQYCRQTFLMVFCLQEQDSGLKLLPQKVFNFLQ